jgi:hypothetical protein
VFGLFFKTIAQVFPHVIKYPPLPSLKQGFKEQTGHIGAEVLVCGEFVFNFDAQVFEQVS